MRSPVLKIVFPIILTLLITISCIKPVSANMAAPPKPSTGNIAGNSPLNNISVLEEKLVINPSDIAGGGLAEVTANYKIECDTDMSSLDLIFVANNLNEKNYLVKLDGNTVNGKISELENIPASWSAPDKISWKNKKIRY